MRTLYSIYVSSTQWYCVDLSKLLRLNVNIRALSLKLSGICYSIVFSLEIYTSDNLVDNKDVCNWIRSLGKSYEIYVKIFKENHVDGYWILNGVTDQTLRLYGIHSAEHRQTILQNIDHIKKHCKVEIQPEPE